MAIAGASAEHLAHGLERSRDGGGDRHQPGNGIDVRVMAEDQEREVEEIAIEPRQALTQPGAGDKADGDADRP